jgi:hypothetical protein
VIAIGLTVYTESAECKGFSLFYEEIDRNCEENDRDYELDLVRAGDILDDALFNEKSREFRSLVSAEIARDIIFVELYAHM